MKYYIGNIPYGNDLTHFGIKGMKWGVRRFQNSDGSLTAAGKARYAQSVERGNERIRKGDNPYKAQVREQRRAKLFSALETITGTSLGAAVGLGAMNPALGLGAAVVSGALYGYGNVLSKVARNRQIEDMFNAMNEENMKLR